MTNPNFTPPSPDPTAEQPIMWPTGDPVADKVQKLAMQVAAEHGYNEVWHAPGSEQVDAMDAFRRGIDQQPHIVEAAPTEPDPVRVALDGVRAAILTDAANRRGRSPATVEAPGTMEEEEPVLTGKTLRDAIAAERAADKARRAKDLELTPDEELPAGMTLKEAIAAERAKWKAEQEASAAELRAHGVNVTGGEFHGVQVSSNITNVGIGSRHRRRRP